MEAQISKLLPRFQKLKNSDYIFTCEKDGYFILPNGKIPIKNLYFMIRHMHKFITSGELDQKATYGEFFVFDVLLPNIPQTSEDAYEYKRAVILDSHSYGTFAKTLHSHATFVDTEPKIEWKPEKGSPLEPFQNVPQKIRQELLLPYPFDENSEDYIVLKGNIVNFQNHSMIYVFGYVIDDVVVIRHYDMLGKEKHNLCLYAEIKDGKYLCKFYFDENENMLFGKHTICGYSDLMFLHRRIYNFDEKGCIKTLVDSGFGYDNARLQRDHVQQSKIYGFGDIEKEDMEDFIKYGLSDQQFDDHRDVFGGY